jgi:CMP-2-keto-3-deoxyoctulosonic acid synthetase
MKLLIANYNPIGISTLIKSATSPISVDNDHPVYVTLNKAKKIITFSRREIPAGHTNNLYYHHIGVYLFSEKILSNKSIFHNCPWAKSELLEQLEFICNGIDFIGVDTESEHYEINTENDLNRAHNFLLTKDKNEL